MQPPDNIQQFVHNWSIETTPGSAAKITNFQDHLHPGTKVAVTFLPGSDYKETVATAERLRKEGMVPVPHFAARSILSFTDFENYVSDVVHYAGVSEAVVLAGALDQPLGCFSSSMQLLETGVFEKHGIKRFGVAGHPEGSPSINDSDIDHAIWWKNKFAETTGNYVYIITQFVFEAYPVVEWEHKLAEQGNKLPIIIGAPGLATIKTLINHARACGIGNSINFLLRQSWNVSKLLTVSTPDKLILDLAEHKALNPKSMISGVHFYPLGGLGKTAHWANAVDKGQISVTNTGFNVI